MSVESSIEQRIREAIERGEFDDLAGKGKPLDLTAYFNTPENLRMAYSVLKSNNFVPEEVEMLKEIADLKDEIKNCQDEERRADLTKQLHQKQLAVTIALEEYKRRSNL
ncbi:MAG: DUF1992 domain-containing protein [Pyrinomonadaceae bacterium]